MKHILEADGIQLQFNTRVILSSVYVKCETGKITGLLGRNGQGKSCLMNVMYGMLKCEKSVRIDNLSQNEAFKRPDLLVYLPQFNFIPPALSLERILNDFELDYSSFEKRFREFSSKQNVSIRRLSGGERRLFELYVILLSKSLFAFLDEPFTHLNPIQIEKVKELLREEKQNKGLLITDHLYAHVMDICDSTYVLADGRTHLVNHLQNLQTLGYARI